MNTTIITENPLGVKPIKSLIWKFAIPGIITQLVSSLHNIVDQIFLGWGVGDLGVAATTVTFPITTVITAVSALIGLGAAARFSILLGKKQTKDAISILGNAIGLTVLIGLILSVVSSVFLDPMLYLFGTTDPIMPFAHPYARITCIGIPFGIFSTAMSYFIRADGAPNFSSFILLAGAIFNIVFDPIFLFVCNMGVAGVALATVLGQCLSALLAIYYLVKKLRTVPFSWKNIGINLSVAKQICSLGAALFTTHSLATISQIVLTNMLKTYGAVSVYGSEVVIAASGAVAKVSIVFLSSIVGIALGCQPILGFNLGNKQYSRVKEAYLTALRYGTMIAVAAFLVLQLFPGQILRIFNSDDPLFYEFAEKYIHIYFAMLFLNAIQPITSTFCTAIGKANLGFWMAVIRQGILLIPLLFLLPCWFGLNGVLLAGGISDGMAAAFVLLVARREVKALTKLQNDMV